MKNAILLIFTCGICCTQLFAQLPADIFLIRPETAEDSARFAVSLTGDAFWFSNAVDNGFISKMVEGGFIDEDLKNRNYKRLEDANTALGSIGAELHFYNLADTIFKGREWGLKLGMEWKTDLQADFTRDLFKISYSGNRDYLGKTADFDNSFGNFQIYQKFGIGLFHKESYSGINISFVNGEEFFRTEIDRGSLFTSANRDSLVLDYSGSIWYSDTARTGFATGNGAGLAVDLYWNLRFEDSKGFVRVEVNDLGFIKWSENTLRYFADSTFTFNGLEVNTSDIINTDNPINIGTIVDTLGLKSEKATFTSTLPTTVRLGMIRSFERNWFYTVDVETRLMNAAFAQFRAGLTYSNSFDLLAGAQLIYSVYGDLRVGMNLEWMPTEHLAVRGGIINPQALVLREMKNGGLNFALTKIF